MTRTQLLALLADLVQNGHLTVEEARRILARFDAGEWIDLPALTQQKKAAPLRSTARWLLALAAVFMLVDGGLGSRLTTVQRQRGQQLLRARYTSQVQMLARTVTRGQKITSWQSGMAGAISLYATQMAVAGAGTLPAAAVREVIDERIDAQAPYLQRFGLQIAAQQVVKRPMSQVAVAARSDKYGAVGWGAYFFGQGGQASNGYVERWETKDDKFVCKVCGPRDGQYFLPGDGPMPGWDCLGDCRCQRVLEYNLDQYLALVGASQSGEARLEGHRQAKVQPLRLATEPKISQLIMTADGSESEPGQPEPSSELPPMPPAQPGEPQGTEISGYLFVPPDLAYADELREALAAVDSVHGDGELDIIPVEENPTAEGEAIYVHTEDKADSIEVWPESERKQLALVHEVGHWMDHQKIGAAMGRQANVDVIAATDDVFTAVQQTNQYQLWEEFAQGTRVIPVTNRLTGEVGDYQPSRGFMQYIMTEQEMWARAYAQYIATRSQSPSLWNQFAAYRSLPTTISYWQDTDFEQVARAIDALMERMQWRRR